MNIVIFEDNKYSNFYPLTKLRTIHQLKCGVLSLGEKFIHNLKNYQLFFDMRTYQQQLFHKKNPDLKIFDPKEQSEAFIILNGRVLYSLEIMKQIKLLEEKKKFTVLLDDNDNLILAYLPGIRFYQDLIRGQFQQESASIENYNTTIINYPWELVNLNGQEIISDLEIIKYRLEKKTKILAQSLNPEEIYLGKNTKIGLAVILDASEGPIIIDDEAEIMHNSVLIGPCYIGRNSKVKIGAKIYENVSLGEYCKVGGEIEGVIFQGYSNKQHEGFLGHSYIAEWCNFGADTNNSDLKNNYSSVLVSINGKMIDSGLTFVGLFMGDHTKTAINTTINTGSVFGIGANICAKGFAEKEIKDFIWSNGERSIKYPLKRIIETAKVVMARRNQELCEEEIKLLQRFFEEKNN